jgi:hypothetical protein
VGAPAWLSHHRTGCHEERSNKSLRDANKLASGLLLLHHRRARAPTGNAGDFPGGDGAPGGGEGGRDSIAPPRVRQRRAAAGKV